MDKNIGNSVLKQIGNNIKTARLLKGLTQEKLSEQLNKSTNFISLIESGKSGISIDTIVDICNILNIEPNTLFNGVITYDNDKDKIIINGISSLSNEDKEIVNNLIEYIQKKNNK
jgi:transcriptional regulator with XRE-family HTH domain